MIGGRGSFGSVGSLHDGEIKKKRKRKRKETCAHSRRFFINLRISVDGVC